MVRNINTKMKQILNSKIMIWKGTKFLFKDSVIKQKNPEIKYSVSPYFNKYERQTI